MHYGQLGISHTLWMQTHRHTRQQHIRITCQWSIEFLVWTQQLQNISKKSIEFALYISNERQHTSEIEKPNRSFNATLKIEFKIELKPFVPSILEVVHRVYVTQYMFERGNNNNTKKNIQKRNRIEIGVAVCSLHDHSVWLLFISHKFQNYYN